MCIPYKISGQTQNGALRRKGEDTERHTSRRRPEAEIKIMLSQAMDARIHQNLEEANSEWKDPIMSVSTNHKSISFFSVKRQLSY